MAKAKIFTFLPILIIFININVEAKKGDLIFVYEHVRHGSRGPSASYNSILENGVDEYEIKWDYDGELSPIGKRQHYYLGVRNYIKYKDFINFTVYNPKEILIHATDYNRTHQSINSELIGMFYHEGHEQELNDREMEYAIINEVYLNKTNKSLARDIRKEINKIRNQVNMQSFPVFNIRKFPDNRIFLVDKCHKLNQYRDENIGQKVEKLYQDFNNTFAGTLKKLPKIKESYFRNYDKMKSIADHFICDYDNKKNLTHLEKLGLNLTKFYNFSRIFYGTFIFDWFVDNYTSGLEETHLMQDLLAYMERRIKHYNETTYLAPKMVMDCGHDTTVGPIARFMDSVFNCTYHTFCDFACNVYFELYRNAEDNKFYVDYYMDDELLLENVEFYHGFKEKMEAKFWNDTYAKEFCGEEEETYVQKEKGIQKYGTFLLGCTLITTTLFIIFATSTYIFYKRFEQLKKRLKENPLLDKEMEGNELPELF